MCGIQENPYNDRELYFVTASFLRSYYRGQSEIYLTLPSQSVCIGREKKYFKKFVRKFGPKSGENHSKKVDLALFLVSIMKLENVFITCYNKIS